MNTTLATDSTAMANKKCRFGSSWWSCHLAGGCTGVCTEFL